MTCSFSYKGISKEDCVNLCNDETNHLCTTYCSNKCNNCQDQSKCAWLLNTTVSPPKPTTPPKKLYNSSKMNDLVDRVVQYSGVSDMLLDDESQMGDELKKLEKIKDHIFDISKFVKFYTEIKQNHMSRCVRRIK